MVGTARSRVNVFMGKCRRLGLIEEDGRRLLVTPALLRVLQDDPDVSNTEHRRVLAER